MGRREGEIPRAAKTWSKVLRSSGVGVHEMAAIDVWMWPTRPRIAASSVVTEKRPVMGGDLVWPLLGDHRGMASSPRKKKRLARQEQSKPAVDAFFAWCDAEANRVLDESPMADGIRYARNQRVALQRFLDDPDLPIHNNISELNLRREVVGRKNWLFVGSDDGAEVNTIFVSLWPAVVCTTSNRSPTCATSSASFRAGRANGSSNWRP